MPDSARTLKVAIPKGSLQEPTIELLAKAGYEIYISSRGLRPGSNDPELDLYMIRAQEIGRYLGQGFIDCGITGYDWAYENDVELIDLGELPYSRATTLPTRWVLVVPEDSPIRKPEDLEGKRIATEGVGITRRYLKERGIQAEDGMWRQLVDDPSSWPETSCTGMFTFAIVTGVKNGWLPAAEYGPSARMGWIALTRYIEPDGEIREVCIGTNKENSRDHYLNRPRAKGDMHGQAPILWTASALLR